MREKIRILFLSANPVDKGTLRLSEEIRAFVDRIRAGHASDPFELTQQNALRSSDLHRALLRYRPHVVHFSGHQSLSEDIFVREDSGKSKRVSEQSLAELFKNNNDTVRVVFFDACFTNSQAQSISRVIDFTVGTSKAVSERIAISFATAFYQALAFGRSVSSAFELASAELRFAGVGEEYRPKLLIREGVNKKEPFQSLSEDADEKSVALLRKALIHAAAGKVTRDEGSLIRGALFEGRLVIEQVGEVADVGSAEPSTFDSKIIGDVSKESANEDDRGINLSEVTTESPNADIWVIPSPEVTRIGTKEDIRVRVGKSAFEQIQKQLYTTPPGLLPPLPTLPFVGRVDALTEIKRVIGVTQTERRSKLTVVRGWPGVGKAALVGVLARDSEIAKGFPDGVLWTSLGQSPNLVSEIARWGRFFGAEDLLRIHPLAATEKLTRLLLNKQMLMIFDDVWNPEDVLPFLPAAENSGCALLATTRMAGVAHDLAEFDSSRSPDESICVLPVLTEENALILLRYLAPHVVERHFDACLELVRELECLPLALQLAGRLLNYRSTDLDLTELITAITKSADLLTESIPLDRAEGAVLPTVGALLGRSTDQLDEVTRDYFVCLGAFAPKPATFDAGALRAVWMVDDPVPIIRKLVNHGLLEPVGAGRFQMHTLLTKHALSLAS